MLGQGIYLLSEMSRFTELHPGRVRSWFRTRTDGSGRGPIFESDYSPVKGDYAFSFLDLIDVLIAGQFRDKHKVSMAVVRKAHNILKEKLNTEHPFCHIDLYTDGKHIFSCIAKQIGETVLSEVVSRQQFFPHIKEKLDHIDYNKVTQLAHRWKITNGIVIDPTISFGKPVIENTGLTTHVVANQYYANKRNSGLIADLYGISETDVHNAVEFEDLYGCKHRQVA